MKKGDKIFVAGARGMVGSAIARALDSSGYENLLLTSNTDLYLKTEIKTQKISRT